ncbi:MAG: hypothetical protein IPM99_19745 [Rubrivivax sp.]|nr:hypothetical protein [Rubrivivax sp.]
MALVKQALKIGPLQWEVKMRAFTSLVAAGCVLLGCLSATASPTYRIDPQTSLLTSLEGLEIGGLRYRVRFMDGSCIQHFAGCDAEADLMWKTHEQAMTAGRGLLNALVDGVQVAGRSFDFDAQPWLVRGCENLDRAGSPDEPVCDMWTPFELFEVVPGQGLVVKINQTFNSIDVGLVDEVNTGWGSVTRDADTVDVGVFRNVDRTWALWELESMPVSAPGTALSSLSGIVLLLVLRMAKASRLNCRRWAGRAVAGRIGR